MSEVLEAEDAKLVVLVGGSTGDAGIAAVRELSADAALIVTDPMGKPL